MTEHSANDDQEPTERLANRVAVGHEPATEQVPPDGELRPVGVGRKALVMSPWQGLVFTLLAGLVVWGTLETILPVFNMPKDLQALQGPAIAPRLVEMEEQNRLARVRNATLSLVILAFTLGLALTVAELLLRREPLRAVWGGLLAGMIAGVIAIGAGAVGTALSDILGTTGNPTAQSVVTPLVKLVIVQGAVLGVMGLGIGLAMSLAMFPPRPWLNCMTGCLLGGLLAALIFPPVVGFLLPNANTEDLVPQAGLGRLLWVGLAAGLIGLTVTGLSKEQKKKIAV